MNVLVVFAFVFSVAMADRVRLQCPDSPASDCPTMCVRFYEPVCAQDTCDPMAPTKVFSNICRLWVYNCENGTNYVEKQMSLCSE